MARYVVDILGTLDCSEILSRSYGQHFCSGPYPRAVGPLHMTSL